MTHLCGKAKKHEFKEKSQLSNFQLIIIYFIDFLFVHSTTLNTADEWIEPGGKIGRMTLEQGLPTLPYPNLWMFCEFMPEKYEPTSYTTNCEVPALTGMTIQFGWLAKESVLPPNWDAMTWELTIDEKMIALESFQVEDASFIAHGENNKQRSWLLNLKDLTPGDHWSCSNKNPYPKNWIQRAIFPSSFFLRWAMVIINFGRRMP